MKKILFLGNASSIHIQRLINRFSEEFEVHVATAHEVNKLLKVKMQYSYKSKLGWHFSYIKLLFKIKSLIKEVKPDLLFSMYTATYGIIGLYSKFSPHLVHAIGSDVMKPPFFAKKLVKKTLSKSDKIYTLMESGSNFITNEYDVSKNKIEVIDWGIDISIFKPSLAEDIPKYMKNKLLNYNIDFQKKYLISPRSCKPLYRIKNIVESYSRIKDKINNNLIILKGNADENYWNDIMDHIKEKELEKDIVIIEDFVTPEEIAILYSFSDITISIPSRDFYPSTVFEAMACNSFVIVSDLEIQNHLINGVNCLKVKTDSDLDQAILKVLEDEDLSATIREKNQEYIQTNQNFQTQTEKINNMLENLINRK